MTSNKTYFRRQYGLVVMAVFICVGFSSLTREPGHPASIWFASAVALYFLILNGPLKYVPLIACFLLSNVAADIIFGGHFPLTLILPIFNCLEISIAAFLLGKWLNVPLDIRRRPHWFLFSMVALLAPLPSSILAATMMDVFKGYAFADTAITWYLAHTLGFLIFTPLLLAVRKRDIASFAGPPLVRKSLLVLLILCSVLTLCFLQNAAPPLFLIFPVLVLTTFWLGITGAMVALFCTVAVSTMATLLSLGPFAALRIGVDEKCFFLQIFFASCLMITLPVASALAEQGKLEEALITARREAERANSAKSRFLALMSHELRTPLHAISGFTEMLARDQDGRLKEKDKLCLKHLLSSTDYLLKIIGDILDLSAIETGKMNLCCTPQSCADIFKSLQMLIKPLTDEKGIRLNIAMPDEMLFLSANREKVIQVLVNLVTNAVKYNRPRGAVDISARRGDKNRVRIVVSDTGRGIPRDKWDKVFLPFSRLGMEDESIEGSGMGLALSKAFVEAMAGSIDFFSIEGKGSEFWIDLPVAAKMPDFCVVPLASSPDIPSHKSTILYIEDNFPSADLMRLIIATFLKSRLLIARTGHEGILKAREKQPDLIISDIHLPDMSGLDVARTLKLLPETSHIPLIALTADVSSENLRDVKGAGFDDLLTKPFHVDEIIRSIGAATWHQTTC